MCRVFNVKGFRQPEPGAGLVGQPPQQFSVVYRWPVATVSVIEADRVQ